MQPGLKLAHICEELPKYWAIMVDGWSILNLMFYFSKSTKAFNEHGEYNFAEWIKWRRTSSGAFRVRRQCMFLVWQPFSSGMTFKGPKITPILDELSSIEKNLTRFNQVVILVDDVRLFESSLTQSDYPSLGVLVDWARANRLQWCIEHDIFILTNFWSNCFCSNSLCESSQKLYLLNDQFSNSFWIVDVAIWIVKRQRSIGCSEQIRCI